MLSYNICIAIIFTESAVKHGFTERAAISVITNAMFAKTSFDTSRALGGLRRIYTSDRLSLA